MWAGVLVGVGAALEVLAELVLLVVAGGPVVVVHHAHHASGQVAGALEEVHPGVINEI